LSTGETHSGIEVMFWLLFSNPYGCSTLAGIGMWRRLSAGQTPTTRGLRKIHRCCCCVEPGMQKNNSALFNSWIGQERIEFRRTQFFMYTL